MHGQTVTVRRDMGTIINASQTEMWERFSSTVFHLLLIDNEQKKHVYHILYCVCLHDTSTLF